MAPWTQVPCGYTLFFPLLEDERSGTHLLTRENRLFPTPGAKCNNLRCRFEDTGYLRGDKECAITGETAHC
ncbi:hypothetical protein JTE90_004091 [Oedothorax gibbosus]|uniref:Uncharacterized protein n=1 Tax=Oedothorax gibbosus TaxID=931172 RepID=A0AAV6UEZ5_9ARAC|nr:hypothetical protein JTE90_004091 [Oedothorax gibbosus]